MQQDGPKSIFINIYQMLLDRRLLTVQTSLFSLDIKSLSISCNTSFFTLSDNVILIHFSVNIY